MKFYNVIAIDKTSNNWQKLNQVKINQSKYKLNQSEDTGAIDVYIPIDQKQHVNQVINKSNIVKNQFNIQSEGFIY